jgi:hypothetical protein
MNRTIAAAKQRLADHRVWQSWADFEVEGRPWFTDWAARFAEYRPHVAIIDSIAGSRLGDEFVFSYGESIRALWIAVPSVASSLRDEVEVCDPRWAGVGDGNVRIRHEAFTGLTDEIERPIADAVPLFWCFVAEKFGIFYPTDQSQP